MNKLDLHPSLTYPSEPRLDFTAGLERGGFLIVLLPSDFDPSAVTRQIWELANSTGLHVRLLSLAKEAAQEPGLRRGLAAVAALIQQGRVCVEVSVETGVSWVEAVKRLHHPGDMIVCFAEQRAGLLRRPLSQILQSNLSATVYILSGFASAEAPRPSWLSQMMAWTGSLGIIIAAFLLQIRITSLPQDWAQTSLLIFSVLGEIWLIFLWNNLFG